MSWSVRHEGSPKTIDGLTPQQVLAGLRDGLWEPTDEVKGPGETAWVAIEDHRLFAEAAAELEPPPVQTYDDETRLDMNPLIDVCLVLLVFFILTTSYAVLQKQLEAPSASKEKVAAIPKLTRAKAQEQAILVTVKMEGGRPVVRVEGNEVPIEKLLPELRGLTRSTNKTTLLLEHDDEVTQGLVVRVQDLAKGAGLDRVQLVVP
jgi:biopolymer transport protein ExbD